MSLISIVHISDLHIKDCSAFDSYKIDSLCNIITNESKKMDDTYIAVSGDIAFSGRKEEYTQAKKIFNRIKNIKNENIHFLICPGNHDCNLIGDNNARDTIVERMLNDEDIAQCSISQLTEAQKNFFEFRRQYQTVEPKENRISSRIIKQVGDISLEFNIVNTAWMSKIKCKPGEIILPLNAIERHNGSNFSVLIMHHTLNWFKPELQRSMRKIVIEGYDAVFTGHEHEASEYHISRPSYESSSIMIEGGNLSPFVDNNLSTFNIVRFDVINRRYITSNYAYCFQKKLYKANQCEWMDMPPKQQIQLFEMSVAKTFLEFLDDPGAPYKHPSREKLVFTDLFIPPNFKEISNDLKDNRYCRFDYTDLSRVMNDNDNIILIVGGEKSGKTSACKYLFQKYLKDDIIPVFVEGERIKSDKPENFEKYIIRSLAEQYTNGDVDRFIQLDSSKKVLIVDDFQLSSLKLTQKIRILERLLVEYARVWIFVDETFLLHDFIRHVKDGARLSSQIKTYSILPFGNILRDTLVRKWYGVGDEVYDDNDNDLYLKIDKTTAMLNVLVESNLVPPYPFYLYTAISSFNSTQPANISESTYGYYYTTLLTIALGGISSQNEEIDLRKNYLTEFAYHIFENKHSYLNEAEVNEFHTFYCRNYSLKFDLYPFVEQLESVSILARSDGSLHFKYKYFYYYFLARYLYVNIEEVHVREVIDALCRSLHVEASGNTVMFLTHLCKNPLVINTIVNQSQCIFQDRSPFRLEDDAALVNQLIGTVPTALYENEQTEEFRAKQLEFKDSNGRYPEKDHEYYSGKNISHECPHEAQDDPEQLMLSLSATHKTLEIIGQILKSYYGSLKAYQKIKLCEEGYNLPMRALSEYFNFLSENKDSLIEEINDILKKKKKVSLDAAEITKLSKHFVFYLSEKICFAFIKRAAYSLGSEHLKITYSEVLQNNNSISNKLLDISIKIKSSSVFPLDEIKRLANEIKGNIISYMILRDIVAFHMYMYPLNYKLRQKICAALDISFRDQYLKTTLSH